MKTFKKIMATFVTLFILGNLFPAMAKAAVNTSTTIKIDNPVNGAIANPHDILTYTVTIDDPSSSASYVIFQDLTNNQPLFEIHGINGTGTYSLPRWWYGTSSGNVLINAVVLGPARNYLATSPSQTITINNNPPTVAFTSPAQGATFSTAGGSTLITVTVSALDTDGTISKVEFFSVGPSGDTFLGTGNLIGGGSYQYNWTNVPLGNSTIYCKATDNLGAVAQSNSVTVTVVFNNAPSVSILTPTNGAILPGSSIHITASATDTDGSISDVKYFANSTFIGSATVSPYDLNWTNIPAGDYILRARATDNSGIITLSLPVNITVTAAPPNNPPTVSIYSPTNNSSFPGPLDIAIFASAQDSDGTISKVEFFNGGTLLGTGNLVGGGSYQFNWTNVPLGNYTISSKATDNLGATTNSSPITVTVFQPATQAPTVSFTSPGNNANFTSPANIPLFVTAQDSDGTIHHVDFFSGGSLIGTVTQSVGGNTYEFDWNNIQVGNYTFTARATDNSGATTTTSSINVNVNPPAPGNQVPIANAGPDQTSNEGTLVTLNGLASHDNDGTVASYAWTETTGTGITLVGKTPTFPAPPVSVYTTLSFNLIVTDDQGAPSSPDVVLIHVNDVVVPPANNPPTVSLTGPANGTAFTVPANFSITGNAADTDGNLANISLTEGNGPIANPQTSAAFSFPLNNVSVGQHTYKVTALDTLGASSFATITITVNPSPTLPTIKIVSPTNGQFVKGDVVVSGTAQDAQGIQKIDVVVEEFTRAVVSGTNNWSAAAVDTKKFGNGPTNIAATATNTYGLTSTDSLVINIDNAAPTVALTSPANNAILNGTAVTLNATAQDNANGSGIKKVRFFDGLNQLGEVDTAPYILYTTLSAGTHALNIEAEDNVGNIGYATQANVSVVINPNNKQPVAILGSDQDVTAGSVVTLDGSGSYDQDGSIVSYSWEEMSGSGIPLLSGKNPSFTAPLSSTIQNLYFFLTVTDDQGATGFIGYLHVTVHPQGIIINPQSSSDRFQNLFNMTKTSLLDIPYSVGNSGEITLGDPNTSGGGYSLAFAAAGSGTDFHIELEVLTNEGEHVATLLDTAKPSGSYTAHWNGNNDDGAKAASNQYLILAKTDGKLKTRNKIILVR